MTLEFGSVRLLINMVIFGVFVNLKLLVRGYEVRGGG